MSEDERAHTKDAERVKELEALLEGKERELAASCRLRDILIEKMLDLQMKLIDAEAKAKAKEPARKVEKQSDMLSRQVAALREDLHTAEERLGALVRSNASVLKRVRINEAPESTTSTLPSAPSPPAINLKFSFNATAKIVTTSAHIVSETDPYIFFSQLSRWEDICAPAEIKRLSLRHNSTTLLTPGGGTVQQVFDPPFTFAPTVVMWLTGVRLARSRPWRVQCRAEDITPAGFTVVVEAWGDAELEAAGVAWVAYEKGKSGFWSAVFRVTGEEQGWLCPIVEVKVRKGCETLFKRYPITIVAVNEVDAMQMGGSFSLFARMSGTSDSKMGWTVRTSGEGSVLSVGCVGMALGELQTQRDTSPYIPR